MNPFLADVCATPFEVVADRSVASLNQDVVERVAGAVEDLSASAQKPLLLLTAPRAGYGKTHLLGRVAAATGTQAVAMPLTFRSDTEVTWSALSHEALDALRMLPAATAPDWSRLRDVCTGIFSSLVAGLIKEGKLPCANREQAMRVLAGTPSDLFREGTQARLIGDWLRKHYGQLRKPLAEAAAQLPGAGVMDGWVDALFAHANHGTATSAQTVMQLATGSREAFELWLRLVTMWRPAVLFVDHLDGFYRKETAGLRIATMLLDLASMEGVHVVLSLNQDVWQATFAHHLPSAIEDRLTAQQFLLRGLSSSDATAMVQLRLSSAGIASDEGGKFERFLNVGRFFQGRPVGSVSARAFLRHAAQQWQTFDEMRARGEEPCEAMMPEEPPSPQADPLPNMPSSEFSAIFPTDDAVFMQNTAAGLSEPTHAMVNTPFAIAAQNIVLPTQPLMAEPTSPFALAEPQAPAQTSNGSHQPTAPLSQPNGPGALDRLREMMDRLRVQTAGISSHPQPTPPPAPTASIAPIAERLAAMMTDATGQRGNDALLNRFNTLRAEMQPEAEQRPLDLIRMHDLIRLAGRRFPLVKFDDIDVPGQPGKTMPRWTLNDQEIVFALADFNDRSAWRGLAQFAAGRVTALTAGGISGQRIPHFKLLALKSDRETMAWTSLLSNDIIPPGLRMHVEALHLDNRSIAALYAMQRMIVEAGNGAISATPAQVMSVLARELDFFWKRVTKPLNAA